MRGLRRALPVLAVLALAGCAGTGGMQRYVEAHRLPRQVELDDTPFFPQHEYQCGPAALATVLAASGVGVTAEQLVPEVYLPARKGSLQPEIVAAARRHGRLPYPLPATPAAMFAELRAGRPVLVLQKQGFGPWPAWHYAVLVGYDADRGRVVLRSGRERRKLMNVSLFLETWQRGGEWSLVLLEPGQLPVEPESTRYLEAAAGFEATGHPAEARAAYDAAVARWPEDARGYLALGNVAALEGDWRAAEQRYLQAAERDPRDPVSRNNRAEALSHLGCNAAARGEVEVARRLSAGGPFAATVESTARSLPSSGDADPPGCPAAAPPMR